MPGRDLLGGLAGIGIAGIPKVLGLTMTDLIERIRRIIEQHSKVGRDEGGDGTAMTDDDLLPTDLSVRC